MIWVTLHLLKGETKSESVSVAEQSFRVYVFEQRGEERRGEKRREGRGGELCVGQAHHSSESSPMPVRETPPSASRRPVGRDGTGRDEKGQDNGPRNTEKQEVG
jgi:hypothetical protein